MVAFCCYLPSCNVAFIFALYTNSRSADVKYLLHTYLVLFSSAASEWEAEVVSFRSHGFQSSLVVFFFVFLAFIRIYLFLVQQLIFCDISSLFFGL